MFSDIGAGVMTKDDLKKQIEDAGCSACWHEEHPFAPVTDDACECSKCGCHPISGSYLHICKTGAWNGVCAKCNSVIT